MFPIPSVAAISLYYFKSYYIVIHYLFIYLYIYLFICFAHFTWSPSNQPTGVGNIPNQWLKFIPKLPISSPRKTSPCGSGNSGAFPREFSRRLCLCDRLLNLNYSISLVANETKTPTTNIWLFPKIRVPQNGWFIMENPIKNGWFGGTIIFGNPHIPWERSHIQGTGTALLSRWFSELSRLVGYVSSLEGIHLEMVALGRCVFVVNVFPSLTIGIGRWCLVRGQPLAGVMLHISRLWVCGLW